MGRGVLVVGLGRLVADSVAQPGGGEGRGVMGGKAERGTGGELVAWGWGATVVVVQQVEEQVSVGGGVLLGFVILNSTIAVIAEAVDARWLCFCFALSQFQINHRTALLLAGREAPYLTKSHRFQPSHRNPVN